MPISKKNWLGYRFATEPHCDLAEQFSFYNVSGREGAARKFNLDFYCKAFGIESPKAHGVTGMDVNTLMAAGKFRDIAEYCLRDVHATVELYRDLERTAGGNQMICDLRLTIDALVPGDREASTVVSRQVQHPGLLRAQGGGGRFQKTHRRAGRCFDPRHRHRAEEFRTHTG